MNSIPKMAGLTVCMLSMLAAATPVWAAGSISLDATAYANSGGTWFRKPDKNDHDSDSGSGFVGVRAKAEVEPHDVCIQSFNRVDCASWWRYSASTVVDVFARVDAWGGSVFAGTAASAKVHPTEQGRSESLRRVGGRTLTTVNWTAEVTFGYPAGTRVAWLDGQNPNATATGFTWEDGGWLLGGSAPEQESAGRRGYTWTTRFEPDGSPIFQGESSDPIQSEPVKSDESDEEDEECNIPQQVCGAFLTDGSQFTSQVLGDHGKDSPLHFREQDANSETRAVAGYVVTALPGSPAFTGFGMADLDSTVEFQIDIDGSSYELSGNELLDFSTVYPEGVAEFLVSGLPEQTDNGLPGTFKLTFAEDGWADFAVFSLIPNGDFNGDDVWNAEDIDLLSTQLIAGTSDPFYDLNGDGAVDLDDHQQLVTEVNGIPLGDANLDKVVEFADFLILSSSFGKDGGWLEGDFDGTLTVDFRDFLILSSNFGKTSIQPASVPEPSGLALLLIGAMGIGRIRRKR